MYLSQFYGISDLFSTVHFLYIFGYYGNDDICVFGFDGALYFDLLSRYL